MRINFGFLALNKCPKVVLHNMRSVFLASFFEFGRQKSFLLEDHHFFISHKKKLNLASCLLKFLPLSRSLEFGNFLYILFQNILIPLPFLG